MEMPDLNEVFITGNLTSDPELRQTTQGRDLVRFGVAVNQRFRGEGDEVKEEVCFLDVVVWGGLARRCMGSLRKGVRVFVEGRLQMRRWERDGERRSKLEVVARKVHPISVLKPPHLRPGWGDDRTEP